MHTKALGHTFVGKIIILVVTKDYITCYVNMPIILMFTLLAFTKILPVIPILFMICDPICKTGHNGAY